MESIVLNNRYELLNLIGTGGMGRVYKAKDNKLDRIVAVKILKEEYLGDDEFIGRFHAEAQAVAKLSHMNIVAVYDVGVDRDMHFIVMELIDGVILSDYVKQMEKLDYNEAVAIAMQIAAALAHAHKNRIVHRDIKPHNVLLSKEGVAKVADFGIAKAASSHTFTLSGKTVGSVHYFSPEQARGGYVDARADIYSLGVVLYEMLTGRPPFDGETPVVVAVKHLQEQIVEPKILNPDIPDEVNKIIVKAMAKSADDRYQTAGEMLNEMEAFMEGKELPSEFKLTLDFVEGTINAADEMSATKDFTPINNTKEKREEYEVSLTKYKKRHVLSTSLAALSALVIILLLTYYGITELMKIYIPEPEKYILEDYRGLEYEKVKAKLESDFNIIVEKHNVFSEKIAPGIIISQDKEQGIVFKELGVNRIRLTVSIGDEEVEIPKSISLEYRIAKQSLVDLGLIPVKIEKHNDIIPIGQVIRTDPNEGMFAKPGDDVTVYVSLGPELKEITIPDFTGMTLNQVKVVLNNLNLILGGFVPMDRAENSVVIEHIPAEGTVVLEGEKVEFKFSVATQRLLVPYEVKPDESAVWSEPIKILIEIIPGDTGIAEIIYSRSHLKTDFPLTITIPVPIDGETGVKLLINNILVSETALFYEDYKDVEGLQVVEMTPGDTENGNTVP